VLLALRYSEPPLFISVPRLLRGNSYLWHVHVIIYERTMTNHICRICHVVEATTPRWTFKVGMREAAREALALLILIIIYFIRDIWFSVNTFGPYVWNN
jgi:hypothetical protein